jgi:hypothetical protein
MTMWLMPSDHQSKQPKTDKPEGKRANCQELNNPTPQQVEEQRKWARWYTKARAAYLKRKNKMSKLPLDIGSPRVDHHPSFGARVGRNEPHPHNKTIQRGRHIDTLPTNRPTKKRKKI